MATDAVVQVPLSCGQLFAVVDAADYPLVSGKQWYARRSKKNRTTYAFANGNGKPIYMHRLIAEAPSGIQVDHRDRDGLNNRRTNLRLCTNSQNQRNRAASIRGASQYKGVSWHSRSKRWRATIKDGGKQLSLGLFTSEEAAGRAYDEAALRLYGEFARLNFPLTEGAAQ